MLNCQPHDIPAIVTARLLKPLGNSPPNGIKFFATADVLELQSPVLATKATNTINQHWRRQNARKAPRLVNDSQNGHFSLVDLSEAAIAR